MNGNIQFLLKFQRRNEALTHTVGSAACRDQKESCCFDVSEAFTILIAAQIRGLGLGLTHPSHDKIVSKEQDCKVIDSLEGGCAEKVNTVALHVV